MPSVHPYILMNYTDKLRDVMTLAHELGHGLHQYLSRGVGYLQCDTPLTTAEMASVFGEMLTFQRLLEIYTEPRMRLALLCSKIEDGFATVFRQVVLTRFEQTLHQARREQGRADDRADQRAVAGRQPADARRRGAADRRLRLVVARTSAISSTCRFTATPTPSASCWCWPWCRSTSRKGRRSCRDYLELLASGGSEAPHVLLAQLGVDVNDPGFWELGLRLLGDMVGEAEQLAAKL